MKSVFINKSVVFVLNLNFNTQDGGESCQIFLYVLPEVVFKSLI